MTESGILGAFTSHAFLQGLRDQQKMRLASGVRPFSAVGGEFLAREGEPAHAFYLIQSGQVQLGTHLAEKGTAPILSVGPGEVVGWSWLLPPHRWQFDARAADDVRGLAFDGNWLREQCEHDHDLGYFVLKQLLTVVSSRLAASRVQRLDIYR